MNEVQIVTPKLPEIKFDFNKVKRELDLELLPYSNLIVTEDTIPECKKSRAELNKLRKSLNDAKIKIKKEWNAPYVVFENNVKDLLAMCDDALKFIDDGLGVYEQKRVDAKASDVRELIASLVSDSDLDQSYERKIILPENYLNVSVTMKSIEEDIAIQIARFEKELEERAERIQLAEQHITEVNDLMDLKSPLTKDDFKSFFNAETFDLAATMSEITDRAKSRRASENKVVEIVKEEAKESAPVKLGSTMRSVPIDTNTTEKSVYTLEITCSDVQIMHIAHYLKELNISFIKK